MSSQVTDALKESINCCIVNVANSIALKSDKGILTDKCVFEGVIKSYQNDLLQKYVPNGTLLQAGFISSATLDVSAFATFGSPINLVIIVNGVIIGNESLTTYPTVDLFGAGIVTAITNGGSGYTATYDPGIPPTTPQTVTINSPDPGSASNGFVVTIVINPQFILDETLTLDAGGFLQSIHIEDTNSVFYEYLVVGGLVGGVTQTLHFIYNRTLVTTITTWNGSIGSAAWSVVYRPDDRTIWTGGFINDKATVVNESFAIDYVYNWGITSGWSVYNIVDNKIYSAGLYPFITGGVCAVDTSNVLQVFTPPITPYIPSPQTAIMAVDETTGNVWIIGINGIFAYDTAGIAPFATIATPGEQAASITYDNTVGSECMYVGYIVPNQRVVKYNLNGTVALDPFYATAGSVGSILYSRINQLIFTGVGNDIHIVKKDGSLYQDMGTIRGINNLVEDTSNGIIIGTGGDGVNKKVYYIEPTNSGSQEFTGALENGTPDVYQTDADQCVSETKMNDLAQYFKAECGCNECTPELPQTIVSIVYTYPIYYGNNRLAVLTNTQVEALTLINSDTYAGSYSFDATSPSEYKYIAYPAVLGTPTRFYDPSTGFDVAMDVVYQVTINSVVYNVWRTYYQLGGAIIININS